jgi:hypothetical protein
MKTLEWSEDLKGKQVILKRTIETGGVFCTDGIWYPNQAGHKHITRPSNPLYEREVFLIEDLQLAASQPKDDK